MKLVVCSDIHAHNYSSHSKTLESGLNSRLSDCIDSLNMVFDHARSIGAPVLCGGDVFHVKETVNVQVLNAVFSVFAKRSFDVSSVTMIPGNHDMASGDGSVHALEIFRSIDRIKVIDKHHVVVANPVIFGSRVAVCCIPFTRDKEVFRKCLHSFKDLSAPRKILLAHCYIHELNRKYMGIDGDFSASELAEDFDLVLLGHHHVHDIVEVGGPGARITKVVSIGSLLQHNFGDRGFQKGFLVVDPETMEVSQVPTGKPEFLAFDGIDSITPEGVASNFVRVRVSSKTEEKKVRDVLEKSGAASVVVETVPETKETRIDIPAGIGDGEILKRFLDSPWVSTELNKTKLMEIGSKYLGVLRS